MSASWSLQKAIFDALSADAALTALLGPGRIYDDVPQGSPLPYVTLAQVSAQDWSTGSEEGTEHLLAVHVWSGERGKRQAHEILGAIRGALHDQPLGLIGHTLINLRHERSEIRREADGATIRGLARFRAVTEPA